MSKRRVTHSQVGEPPADTWSNCLIVARHVYIAGMTARGQEFDGAIQGNDAYSQAVAIFTKIKHLMEAAGGTIDDVVKVLIYLTDIKLKPAMNEAWKAWLGNLNRPTRTCIGGVELEPGVLVEITSTAAK